jgi:NitT/TauT family transport system substrate-binding protein
MKYLLLLAFLNCSLTLMGGEKTLIRVGHFPNLTHAQAVLGHHFTSAEKGWFEERLGPDVEVHWFVYNAGPSAMEAILTEAIDLTYVGPSPAINAYIRSKGEEVRIICGSCSGGAALVVQPDGRIRVDADFRGKRIATPQFGNSQDVQARAWLESIGLNIKFAGGDAFVIPMPPSDQFLLFKKRDLDAAWTIEPWVSRLVLEADAHVYFEESVLWPKTHGKYVTTHLVSRKNFLKERPDLIKKWILAQVELTEWINDHPEEARELISLELKKETHIALPNAILDRAWRHIELTYDPIQASLFRYAYEAFRIGFLKKEPDLQGIYDLRALNTVLLETGRDPIHE